MQCNVLFQTKTQLVIPINLELTWNAYFIRVTPVLFNVLIAQEGSVNSLQGYFFLSRLFIYWFLSYLLCNILSVKNACSRYDSLFIKKQTSVFFIFRRWVMQTSWSWSTALWAEWQSFDKSFHYGGTPTFAVWGTIIEFLLCCATHRKVTCSPWR